MRAIAYAACVALGLALGLVGQAYYDLETRAVGAALVLIVVIIVVACAGYWLALADIMPRAPKQRKESEHARATGGPNGAVEVDERRQAHGGAPGRRSGVR